MTNGYPVTWSAAAVLRLHPELRGYGCAYERRSQTDSVTHLAGSEGHLVDGAFFKDCFAMAMAWTNCAPSTIARQGVFAVVEMFDPSDELSS